MTGRGKRTRAASAVLPRPLVRGLGRNWPGPLSPAKLIGTQLIYRGYYRLEMPNEI
jgi:hypothetical protein